MKVALRQSRRLSKRLIRLSSHTFGQHLADVLWRAVKKHYRQPGPWGKQKMAKTKIYRVVIEMKRNGWAWTPTDPQGRVKLEGGKSGYSRSDVAVRGARRACGATVKIAHRRPGHPLG